MDEDLLRRLKECDHMIKKLSSSSMKEFLSSSQDLLNRNSIIISGLFPLTNSKINHYVICCNRNINFIDKKQS